MRLTKKTVDAAEPDAMKDRFFWDEDLIGFGLRVTKAGVKSYVVQYRVPGARLARRLTIAKVGKVTPEQARQTARTMLADVVRGQDPAEIRKSAREAPTVGELLDRFDKEHIAVRLKPKTARSYRRLIESRIRPAFGTTRIVDVTRADVAKWHHKMRDTPVEANRALVLLQKIMNTGELWGLRAGSNPAQGVPKFSETSRERYLNSDELYRLGMAISELESAAKQPLSPYLALAFRLLLLTGMRRDEVMTLKWEYVDLEDGVIRLPDSRPDASRWCSARQPLTSSSALHMRRIAIGSFHRARRNSSKIRSYGVSPSRAWERVKERASSKQDKMPVVDIMDVTLHDCRHAFAAVGVSAGLSLPAIGALLGHADQASTQRYAHLSADARKLAADRVGGGSSCRSDWQGTRSSVADRQSVEGR